jgi:hypothetical protein
MSKNKMKKAHQDIQVHLDCLASRHEKNIGLDNLLYLIFFETFRCLFDVAPTKKEAMELMKDAMKEAKGITVMDKKAKEIIERSKSTLH